MQEKHIFVIIITDKQESLSDHISEQIPPILKWKLKSKLNSS